MQALRRKITDALGGGNSATASAPPTLAVSPRRSMPAPLVITSSSYSPAPHSAPPRAPEPSPSAAKLSASINLGTSIGSPRSASPAVQSSPLHQHQPVAPRRTNVAWVPDNLAEKCYSCQTGFSLMLRRHHCRRCGNVFCDACTQSRIPLVSAGFLTPVRVCDKCCVAAKRAHARLVEDRQQQWLQEQNVNKEKRNRLRSMRSDDSVTYDESALFPPPRSNGHTTSASGSRRVPHSMSLHQPAQPRQFIRSQTVRNLTGPSIVAKQFFADPFSEADEDEEERRSFERRTGLGNGDGASKEVSVHTLPGEILLVRCENVKCHLMNQNTQSDGTLYVTTYRIVFSPTIAAIPEYEEENRQPLNMHQAIPLGTIERLKRKETAETDSGLLDIVTKDFRHVQFFFDGLVAKQTFNQFDRTVYTIRQYAFGEPTAVPEPFVQCTAAATANALALDEKLQPPAPDGWKVYDAAAEFRRMGVGSNAATATPRWRLTSINEDYGLCATYPALLAVPASVGDQVLTVAAKYRSKSRIPVLSWRDTRTGAVISRSSQPLVGLGQRQCDKDVFLIQAISVANPSSSKFVIIDARPWKNAVAQKTVGRAGYELTEQYETRHTSATSRFADLAASSTDFGGMGASSVLPSPPSSTNAGEVNYDDEDDGSASTVSDRIFRQMDAGLDPSLILTECKLIFMGIENIHTMRRSYNKLLDLCIHKPTDKWVEHLGASRWIEHISKILDSAIEIVRIVHDQKSSVLVHCSDGWDRTPQLTSLAQLMMDPYYRTITGFQILIEKEWCSFGHKFRDRAGHAMNPASSSDVSPVFLQFIDCVWQIYRQFPCSFEFNEQFLMLILDHLYSCRFGTFLYDSEKERREKEAAHKTISLWTYVASLERTDITNPFYSPPHRSNGVSISEVGALLDQTSTSPPDLDSIIASTLSGNPPTLDERDEEDAPIEKKHSAFNLFPSAASNGAHSSPITIPTQTSRKSLDPATPPTGKPPPHSASSTSPESPELFPSAIRPHTTSSGSRSSFTSSSPGTQNGTPSGATLGLVNEEVDENEVLRPCAWSRSLQFWSRYYLRWDPSTLTDRIGTVWIEAAHRDLLSRLEEAERRLLEVEDLSEEERSPSVNLPELVQVVAKSMGEEGPVTATVPQDVVEKLEALEQRKRDAIARLEREFEEEAARLLKPTMERPATAAS